MSQRARIVASSTLFLASGIVLVAILVRATLFHPEQEVAPPPAVAFAAAAIASSTPAGEYPAQVAIPAISVDAAIQSLGLIAGNRMRAPTNYTDIGWFKYGIVPGAAGTAVLYAHLDNGLGLSGVFKDLDKLSVGDTIQVVTKDNQTLAFTVDDIETYPYDAVPLSALGEGTATDGAAHISLITCAGSPIYDKTIGFTYDHRLVVRATLTNS